MRPKIIIIGAGGHASSVGGVAVSAGYEILNFVDPAKFGQTLMGKPVLGEIPTTYYGNTISLAIAVGHNFRREQIYEDLVSENLSFEFPTLIHPSAVVSFNASIELGTVVMPKAVIGPNSKVARFCLINTSSVLDHDSVMEIYSSLAPGAVIAGNVKIGERSAISLNACVKHGVTVGKDSVLGSSSYLNKDLQSFSIAYGTPAKIIRSRSKYENYLT